MNGRIAQSALHPCGLFVARNARALLLVVCCAMSLALLGAVRAQAVRPVQPVAAAEGSLAESTVPAPLGALNEPEQRILVSNLPAGVEWLRTAAAAPAPVISSASPLPTAAAPLRAATPVLDTPKSRTILMEVTAYCACTRCCGPRARGITASGKRVTYNGGRFVAADTRLLKFNTRLIVPGYASGQPVEVIDRGGAIKGNKLDVYFDSHQEARRWGRQWLVVTVVP
jgi:3D (Asp-Asp-Asp) domain-containing protein